MSGDVSKVRFEALDSWRGLCALLVALFHFPLAGEIRDNAFIRHSYLFVDFFFVLSGFIIAITQARRPDAALPFLLKRFGRIWPLHMAVLLAFVLMALLQGDLGADERHSFGAIWTNVLMVHAWGIHTDLTWNGPSWSVSVEWLLYIVFAVLAAAQWRLLAYGGLVLIGIGALLFFAPGGMGATFDFGVARGLAGFFMGALIARAPLRDLGTWAEVATTLAVVLFVAAGEALYIAPFVFGGAVWVFAGSRGALTKALETGPLIWLGERSYTTYIVHAMVVAAVWGIGAKLGWQSAGGVMLAPGSFEPPAAIAYLGAIVGISALAYPAEDRCRRWFRLAANALSLHRVPARR
jgi:peptidoglycan/LPS O-acetylase OafA/YrhL